ncbi:MAG TPA: peptidylprolyl isomerase [Gammaproteobacteria bacterium]|nr:peptidylprolyl isomerase [Gammaproteobacteria bacterium]
MSQLIMTKRSRWLALFDWARRAQQSRALPVLGFAVGIAAAGAGIFHGAQQAVTQVPPGYVAVVNGKGILMSDFISQTATEAEKPFDETSPAERSQVLQEMIDEELMVQRGTVLDLPETTIEVRDVMVDAVTAQVAAPILAEMPSDADLRNYYNANRAKYTTDGSMLVHDLVLHIGGYQNVDQSAAQAETDATEAVYQLKSGASISYVKEHFGFVDSGRSDNTEQLDFAAKLHLGAKLYQVAATLHDGDVSDPVLDTDGMHVLVMDRRLPPRIAAFDSVRDKVYNDYRKDATQRAKDDNLRVLRSQARILVAPEFGTE